MLNCSARLWKGRSSDTRTTRGHKTPRTSRSRVARCFDRLNQAANGSIRYVNVVPEHGDQALDLISYLAEQNVLVGAGHTGATADMYKRAVSQGLRIAVHFTNGPTGSSFKPFRGR